MKHHGVYYISLTLAAFGGRKKGGSEIRKRTRGAIVEHSILIWICGSLSCTYISNMCFALFSFRFPDAAALLLHMLPMCSHLFNLVYASVN